MAAPHSTYYSTSQSLLFLSSASIHDHSRATMEHSTAILEDAGKKIDNAAAEQKPKREDQSDHASSSRTNGKKFDNRRDDRKRKGNWNDNSVRQGGRGGKFNDNKRHKKSDLGRGDYLYVTFDEHERALN